jgi:RNA polymerase sigma-70 factor (ECF subfamily)
MDEALVRSAAGGDSEAFDALARDRIDRLFAIAFRILRDQHDAEDAVQQALWTAWSDLPGLRDPARFDAWLYRLLVRKCYLSARSRRRRDVIVQLVPELHDVSDQSRADEIAEREALEQAFATLSTEHRAVMVLHHYLGLGLDEIAAILEIPYGTARSRSSIAARRLREALTLGESRADETAGRAAG